MKTLCARGNDMLQARTSWEQKQRMYSQMRHDGLRRRTKPFPGAADLHFPLIDMNIRKAKPFWESQATSAERLASFVSLQQQLAADTTAAAEFFDFELKQNTNYLQELLRAIDWMCLRGRGVLKAVVDPFEDHRIVFEAPDPYYILMAEGADDFEDADEFVHVQHFSVARYKRNRRYLSDEDTIRQIRGLKDVDQTGQVEIDKETREGINATRNPNVILLWEHYVKNRNGWMVSTYSPRNPDVLIRKPFGMPYKVAGKPSCPYYSFKTELKDKGWYAPRGLAELNAAFEAYACKLWNEKTDSMTFANRPVFTSENEIKNTANIRWTPGEYIPGMIQAVQMPTPAYSFDQEIAFARSTAEQVSMLPDFGITQPGDGGQTAGKPRTATENNRISQLQTVGTDSNGRLFRMDLAKVYKHVWGLLLQFKRQKMIFYVGGELKQMPEQALHDAYLIAPDGAADQWNKQLRMQRAGQRYQMFKGAPNVDQDELTRDVMSEDDPLFALRAFVPTNAKAGDEAEQEALDIVLMRDGFPAAVKPNEDHATRLHVLASWLQKMDMSGQPPDPAVQQNIQQHMAVHFQYLQQQQPDAARQVKAQLMQMEQQAQQMHQARQLQQQQAMAAQPPAEGNPNPS